MKNVKFNLKELKSSSSAALPRLMLGKSNATNVSTKNVTNTYSVIWLERAINAKRAMITTEKNDKQTSSDLCLFI